jgi:hypothetical protein
MLNIPLCIHSSFNLRFNVGGNYMSEHYIWMQRERETEMIFEQIEAFVLERMRVCVCERALVCVGVCLCRCGVMSCFS